MHTPSLWAIFCNHKTWFFTADKREPTWYEKYGDKYCSHLTQMLGFVYIALHELQNNKSHVVISGERRGHSVGKWQLITSASIKLCLINFFKWRSVWGGHHLTWKWYLNGIHAVEVARLQSLSTYHGTVVLRRKRFGFHLQISFQKILSNDKDVRKTTPYKALL